MNVRGLVFNDDPAKEIRLYACGVCGNCFVVAAYGRGVAMYLAEQCCVTRSLGAADCRIDVRNG